MKYRSNKDRLLRLIHGMVIGKVNKSVKVRENLSKFSGVVYDDDLDRDSFEERIGRQTTRSLREVLAFFGQDPKGDAAELIKKVADFMERPEPSTETYKLTNLKDDV
jgi:hypothetical protein